MLIKIGVTMETVRTASLRAANISFKGVCTSPRSTIKTSFISAIYLILLSK